MQLTDEQRKAIEWAIGMASQHNIHNSPLRALLAAHSAGAQEPVAEVESWTNGSYHRNYKLRWLKDVEAGAKLYAHPQPMPQTDAARDVLETAAVWLHASYDRPPQSPECKAMLRRIDAEIERIDRAKGE